MTAEPDEDGIIWKPFEGEQGITLDLTDGAYVDLQHLAIWITDQQPDTGITDPLYSHWVTGQLLKAARHNLITILDDVALVDDRLKAFITQRFKVQFPDAEGQVIAPATRETPSKDFIRESVKAYQHKAGQFPESLNALLGFAVKNGIPGYSGITVSGDTQRNKVIRFTDSEPRAATFRTLNDALSEIKRK